MYESCVFLQYSIHLNSILACTRSIIDLKLNNMAGPSISKLYGNMTAVLLLQNTEYSYLWSDNDPGLQQSSGRSIMIRDAFQDSAMLSLVPTLYSRLWSPPNLIVEQYRTYFNAAPGEADSNLAVENVEISADTTTDDVVDVEKYGATQNVSVQTNITGGPLLDDSSGILPLLRSFKVSMGGLFQSQSSVVRIPGNQYTHWSEDGRASFAIRRLKPS